MTTPRKSAKPYWLSTVLCKNSSPAKEMAIISPATVMIPPVLSTAKQIAALSDQPLQIIEYVRKIGHTGIKLSLSIL